MKTYLKPLGILLVILVLISSIPFLGVSAETYLVENNFKFTKGANGEITVCGYLGKNTEITIPSKLAGYDVEYIGEYAFLNNTKLTSITLPSTMKQIGKGAFYGCTKLQSINIPVNCVTLGDYLFYGCTSLKDVTFEAVAEYIPRFCFRGCTSLTELKLPETTKTIGQYAFAFCPNLEEVYIPPYAQSIDNTAFLETPHGIICSYLDSYPHTFAQENGVAFKALDESVTTYYVTYYNYDNSVYWITSAKEGSVAMMPAKAPIKPATDTCTYEFMYWEGNISNISENTDVYPVFREIPIPEPTVHYVVFLNGDFTELKAQIVREGEDATPPETIPTKEAAEGKYYTFSGWNKSYENIQEDTVILPVFTEHTESFIVTFLDANGEVFASYQVPYKGSSPLPESVPESSFDEGPYEFVSWDTDTSCVTSDLTVRPVFEEIKPTPERPMKTTGNLKIDVGGGTGFKISVNGGAARPQGTAYVNSKAPVGATVTLTANQGGTFLGWVNAEGLVLTNSFTYTFTTTGNDYVKALYQTDIEDATLVIFKNDKANQILDMQYYMEGDEIIFPEYPVNAAWQATGWTMTDEEIASDVRNGESVTVTPTWTKILVYVDVTVSGGTATGVTDGKTLKFGAVTAVANAAPEGEKFAYWADENGKVRSYSAEYTFYPAEDTNLTAVYVDEDETVDYEIILGINMDTSNESPDINTVILSWEVAENSDFTFVQAGSLIVEESKYNADTFYKGTTDSNVTRWTPGSANQIPTKTITVNKKGVESGSTWILQGWLTYKDSAGNEHTVYTDLVYASKA